MSSGHARTVASIDTVHGILSAPCVLAWVRCDGCGATRTGTGLDGCEGDTLCDELADGWTGEGRRDLCEVCGEIDTRETA